MDVWADGRWVFLRVARLYLTGINDDMFKLLRKLTGFDQWQVSIDSMFDCMRRIDGSVVPV